MDAAEDTRCDVYIEKQRKVEHWNEKTTREPCERPLHEPLLTRSFSIGPEYKTEEAKVCLDYEN